MGQVGRTSAKVPPPGRTIEAATKNDALVRNRREQLVEAALEVFSAQGFHKTTVRDIGRVSGLTQGTIYNYVRSKEDILYLVFDRIVSEYAERVEAAMSTEGDPVARVLAALRGVATVMVEQKAGILMIYHDSHNLDRDSRRHIVARIDAFITSFERLLADVAQVHPLAVKNVRTLANVVTFVPTIFALRGWGFSSGYSEEVLIDEVVEFMAKGLGLPAAGNNQETYSPS